jgi:hypothetical protein
MAVRPLIKPELAASNHRAFPVAEYAVDILLQRGILHRADSVSQYGRIFTAEVTRRGYRTIPAILSLSSYSTALFNTKKSSSPPVPAMGRRTEIALAWCFDMV